MNFEKLTNRQFAARIAGMIKTGPEQRAAFWNLVYNAIIRTMETKDTTHVNKMVQASLAVGRFRSFIAVATGIVPFSFDKEAKLFNGKMKKGKLSALCVRVDPEDENSDEIWFAKLKEYIELEQTHQATARPADWSMPKSVLSLVRKAVKAGVTQAELIKEVEKDYAEVKSA